MNNGKIRIKDIDTKKVIRTLETFDDESTLLNLFVSSNGNFVTSTKTKIKLWLSSNWNEYIYAFSFDGFTPKVAALSNGNLITIFNYRTIVIWDPTTLLIAQKLIYHNSDICDLVLMNNNLLASASLDYTIVIWNLNNSSILNILKPFNDGSIIKLTVLPNNNLIVATNKYLAVWNINENSMIRYLSIHSLKIESLIVLKNGYLVCSFGTLVKIYDPLNGKMVKTLMTYDETIITLSILENGNLIGGSLSGNLMIWNTERLK